MRTRRKAKKARNCSLENLDDDIVVTMSSRGGVLPSARMRLFLNTGHGFVQVGLIGKLKLKASAKNPHAQLKIRFPNVHILRDRTLRSMLVNNAEALRALGADVSHSPMKEARK